MGSAAVDFGAFWTSQNACGNNNCLAPKRVSWELACSHFRDMALVINIRCLWTVTTYKNMNNIVQLMFALGSAVSSPNGVRGEAPAAVDFGAFWTSQNACGNNNYCLAPKQVRIVAGIVTQLRRGGTMQLVSPQHKLWGDASPLSLMDWRPCMKIIMELGNYAHI